MPKIKKSPNQKQLDFGQKVGADYDSYIWPEHSRFPLNVNGNTLGSLLKKDVLSSQRSILVVGYASLTEIIELVCSEGDCKNFNLMMGHEPFASNRSNYSSRKIKLHDEIKSYWAKQGVSLRQSAKILKTIELVKSGTVKVRTPKLGKTLHAKVFVTDEAAYLGSSNFTAFGLRHQFEANARFASKTDSARYRDSKLIAENCWDSGDDFSEGFVQLLESLLQVVDWREALAYACSELLEGEWASAYLEENYLSAEKLWPSQKQGIAQALYILANQGSVLIADATGSGKTKLGVHLVGVLQDDLIRSSRVRKGKPVLVCPPLVEGSWREEMAKSRFGMESISQGRLSTLKETHVEATALRQAQIICVDEAHNFLAQKSNRTQQLFRNIADHVVLFTATPINKSVKDLLSIADLLGADNLRDETIDAFKGLLGFRSGKAELTNEDVDLLRTEVQRFTVRRTKKMLNELVDQSPDSYVSRTGELCRFPEHIAKYYSLNEPEADCQIAEQIRVLASELYGVTHFAKPLKLPMTYRKRGWQDEQYLSMRIKSAKALSSYLIMSSLRSSKLALLEHIVGTKNLPGSLKLAKVKTDTGDTLRKIYRCRRSLPEVQLSTCEVPWLMDLGAYEEACEHDLGIYTRIRELVDQLSETREMEKAKRLLSIAGDNHAVLAFDSRPVTLYRIAQILNEEFGFERSIVATGSTQSDRKELVAAMELGSSVESGIIALCSDSLSEGVNLQAASSVVHLDMPSVIRVAEQRSGRVDRLDSPHERVTIYWPEDATSFALKADERFVERFATVDHLLGSNMQLPDYESEVKTVEYRSLVEEFEKPPENWDGIADAFAAVRSLVSGDRALVSTSVYRGVLSLTQQFLCRVSLIKSPESWAFFSTRSGAFDTPGWHLLTGDAGYIENDLEAIVGFLRDQSLPESQSLELSEAAIRELDRFVQRLRLHEIKLLPKKKQRAIHELKIVLDTWITKMGDNKDQERLDGLTELKEELFGVDAEFKEADPDWEKISSLYLDLIRPIWFRKLGEPRRKPLLLADVRGDVVGDYSLIDKLLEAFSELPYGSPIENRIRVCVLGVP